MRSLHHKNCPIAQSREREGIQESVSSVHHVVHQTQTEATATLLLEEVAAKGKGKKSERVKDGEQLLSVVAKRGRSSR